MKHYIGNTFVDPTHCRFRYTKILYKKEKIAYHVRHLADQAKYQTSKPKKKKKKERKKRHKNAYNIAILVFIALPHKGCIGGYRVTVSAIAKIHS